MRRGFSLVELMVAVALAMMVVLITASAFRLAAQSIARARAMSEENRLLRLGMVHAIDDLDFWRSYGDPRMPYDKAFLQEQRSSDVTIGSTEHAPRIAPMRRVTFAASTALADTATLGYDVAERLSPGSRTGTPAYGRLINPASLLGHDPRSWYRGHHYPARDPDFALFDDNAARWPYSQIKDNGKPYRSAFEPCQLWGPYHLLASTDMADAEHAGQDLAQRQIAMSGPNFTHRVFQRLGDYGMALYLPKGMPWLALDRSGATPGVASVPTHPLQTREDRDYRLGANLQDRSRNANPTYGARYEAGVTDVQAWGSLLPRDNRVSALFIDPTDFPGREIVNEPFRAQHNNEYGDRSWLAQASLLVHLPFNRATRYGSFSTNGSHMDYGPRNSQFRVLDYSSKPTDLPILSHTSLRYANALGGDICLQRVLVDNVASGQVVMITFSALGSCYRGARQHYRVAGAELGYDMGDWYE